MPAFRARKWREPHTEVLVQGEDLEDWQAPDHYVYENVEITRAGEVVFVEVERSDATWQLWRCASVRNPLSGPGMELPFGLLTAEITEAEAEAEMRAMGVKPPARKGAPS
jgi:hypothetical protein